VGSTSWVTYAVACLILWGLWGLVLKVAYRGGSWVSIYFLSSLASFAVALSIFILTHGSLVKGKAALLACLAGFFGGAGYVFFIKALEKGKASVVIPLTALYPAVTAVLALLILKEKLTPTQAVGIALAIVATLLLSL